MKKEILLTLALGFVVSACFPALPQTQRESAPVSEEDLRLTAAVISEQTLQALPTPSPLPSETPIILTTGPTPTQPTPTETVNPVLLTLTATLLAGTPAAGTPSSAIVSEGAPTASETPVANNPSTPQSGYSGTLPPFLPYGVVQFVNKADADVYISLRCVTKEGYVTILEYPVKKIFSTEAPAGNYTYVAWVGGRQFDGGFKMDKGGFVTITFYKNRINVKKD